MPSEPQFQERRDTASDLELWKHFAATGAADKNTMISSVSWLLGFAAALLGFIGKESTGTESSQLIRLSAFFGVVVSVVAAYISLLYGGYANKNWAKADEIASRNQWTDLVADPTERSTPTKLAALSMRLAHHCDPRMELAPVFSRFFGIAVGTGLVSLGFLIWWP